MSSLDDWVLEPETYWFKYLTKDERKMLNDRAPQDYVLYCESFTVALWSRFKYLYNRLTEEEWNYWKGITERVEKQIKDENGK